MIVLLLYVHTYFFFIFFFFVVLVCIKMYTRPAVLSGRCINRTGHETKGVGGEKKTAEKRTVFATTTWEYNAIIIFETRRVRRTYNYKKRKKKKNNNNQERIASGNLWKTQMGRNTIRYAESTGVCNPENDIDKKYCGQKTDSEVSVVYFPLIATITQK